MKMTDFRRMAAKMDQHMQLLAAQGFTEPHQVINHMGSAWKTENILR